MEWVILILLLIVAWIWGVGYRAGKREGSRKAYGIGFDRGRLVSDAGCMVMLGLAGALLALASGVLACW